MVEKGRADIELRYLETVRQAALESEAYAAWRHATQYNTFKTPLKDSKQEPKNSSTLTARDVWIKSFQRSDVKPVGRSQKFGNTTYQIVSIIGFNDQASASMASYIVRQKISFDLLRYFLNGEWHHVSAQCKVEKMDAPGDWIASDWKFSPVAYNGDFPFDKLKGED